MSGGVSSEFVGTGTNAAGSPVIRGSFCITENSCGALCFVLEKEAEWWKKVGHIGLPGGRAEELEGGVLEGATETIVRELPQESSPGVGRESKLVGKGGITLLDVLDKKTPIEVTIFSLYSEFEAVENDEVQGVVYTKQEILAFLERDDGYLKFRPLVLEALALHFGLEVDDEETQIRIAEQNYATKPERIVAALIDILSKNE